MSFIDLIFNFVVNWIKAELKVHTFMRKKTGNGKW